MDELKKVERRFRYLSKLFFPRWDNSKWTININPNLEPDGECGFFTPDGYYREVITIKYWLNDLNKMDALILHEIIHAVILEKALKLFKNDPNSSDHKIDGAIIGHGSMFHKEKNRVKKLAERRKRNKLAWELALDSCYSIRAGRKERRAERLAFEREYGEMP